MHRVFSICIGLAIFLMVGVKLTAQTNSRHEIEQHYKQALEAMQSNQADVAAKEFREILRLEPNNAMAHANLGVIGFMRKDFVQASQEFRAALRLQPALWNAKAFLGMSEFLMGHAPEAKPLLEDSFKHLPDAKLRAQVGLNLIALYYQSGELDPAVDIVRALLRDHPEAPDVLYTAYRTYTDLAARSLTALARVEPESAQMHQILAQALASQDDFPGAIAQYRKALEIDPQLPGIHYELGQMILANSTEEPAREQAEKEFGLALAADPGNANSEYMLGEIEWLRSKPQEALKHYIRALELRPNFEDAHIAAGKVLTNLGRPSEALSHLLEAVRLAPQNEVAHYRLAQAYRKLGRLEDADREGEAFRRLRDSHAPVRALYQQIQQRPVLQQTVDPSDAR